MNGPTAPCHCLTLTTPGVATDAAGLVSQVRLSLGDSGFKGPVRAYYMVDTYPAAHAGLEVGVKKSD